MLETKEYIFLQVSHLIVHSENDFRGFYSSLTKDRGELERQCDSLGNQVQTSKNRIATLEQNIGDLKEALSKKVQIILPI